MSALTSTYALKAPPLGNLSFPPILRLCPSQQRITLRSHCPKKGHRLSSTTVTIRNNANTLCAQHPLRQPQATRRWPTTSLSLKYTRLPVYKTIRALSSTSFRYSTSSSSNPSPPPPSSSPKDKTKTPLRGVLLKHENIYTIPNILTFTRLLAAPGIGYLIIQDQYGWALGLFVYAGITDLVDGWIARKWNLTTVVGTVIDPMADKLLMVGLTAVWAWKGVLPVWLVAIILGRDIGLGIAAIFYRWISLPPPKTMTRYWDFSIPSAEVHPTTISKVNTALQLALIGICTAQPLIGSEILSSSSPYMTAFHYLVGATTVWSGLSYVYTKDAVKILTPRNLGGKRGSLKKGTTLGHGQVGQAKNDTRVTSMEKRSQRPPDGL